MAIKNDLNALLEPLARRFFGEVDLTRSRGNVLYFGSRGALKVDLQHGRWFDYEANVGGGVLDLVKLKERCANDSEAFAWLEREGFWNGRGGKTPKVDGGKSAGTEAGTVASVQFMLTAEHKRSLQGLGYTAEQIHHMTPEAGLNILAQGRKPSDDDDAKRKLFEEARREFEDELEDEPEDEGEDGPEDEPEDEPNPTFRVIPLERDLAMALEAWLKNNPDCPFSEERLQQFARLLREQPEAFVRLRKRYGALAAAVRLNAATVRAALESVDKDAVVEAFAELVVLADLDAVEIDALRRFTAEKSGVGLRPLALRLKAAQAAHAAACAKAARAARRAARTDPRPMLRAPASDDPWLPVMTAINGVLGTSTASEPPTRDIDGYLTRASKNVLPGLHLFSTANEVEEPGDGSLPPPEQWLLRRMGKVEVAETIEQHIDYVDANDKSVHLDTEFVKHYIQRDDGDLRTVVAIATLPIVLGDGTLLAPDGLDRKRGIIFKVPRELRDVLPRPEGCDEDAVREAMRFLCDV